MKALVVYDSTYGHTEKIARAIGEAIGGQVLRVGEVSPADLKGYELLIIGSPTHGGFYTPEGFFVLGVEGPLMEGELERAACWAGETASICLL